MIWVVLACSGEPAMEPADQRPDQPPPRTHRRLRALPMPDSVPFHARTRTQPLTLVDEHGQPLLVIEALGVKIRIERLLPDRAYGACIGCRAEVAGWFQRQGLLVTETTDPQGLALEEAMVRWLDSQQQAFLDHGLIRVGDQWKCPPWYAEPGYQGLVGTVSRDSGGAFQLATAPPPPRLE